MTWGLWPGYTAMMRNVKIKQQLDQVIRDYRRLRALVPLGTLRTKKDYARAVEMLDTILDEVGENEKHPMAELADAISVFIEKYETEHDAVLIDMTRFDKLRKPDDEFERLTARIKKTFSKIPRQKGVALIDEAGRAARKKRNRKFSSPYEIMHQGL